MDSKSIVTFGAGVVTGLGVAYWLEYVKKSSVVGIVAILANKWDTLDSNKDGKVSKEEFVAGARTLLKDAEALTAEELEAFYRLVVTTRARLDTNGDGQISRGELAAGLKAALGGAVDKAVASASDLKTALAKLK
eukprot:TRINITY_DN2969_c0_g1_i1.p1 TRINITY_DN2969_c0_g1~~TRINITY_DN2969_c0_g1_i1.p1  ORF type:complete len:135 (+),score=36.48 TRINITY_DN2969_c0_g1_i1:115-519(+)